METEVNPEQLLKVPSAIFVIELGMDMDFRFWQARKACCPIEVTELGMVTESRLVQRAKA